MQLILVCIWRDNLPKYGRVITKLFLGTVLTTGLGASTLSKKFLMHLSTRNLLNIATKETFFMFNNKYYKQLDGVAMGSPLGPALANIFMCSFESKWLHNCPNDFKPVFYRCYIDDIFVLFSSPDHADKFREYLSSKHPNINFSIEKGEDGFLPFLDINIFCEDDKFATNDYRKKTFSGVYNNFKSFIPETYKIGLIKSLLFWCFSLFSDFIKFHLEIDKLKSILHKNSYLHDVVDKCIKELR